MKTSDGSSTDKDIMFLARFRRTIEVVKQLAVGKELPLPDGRTIAMGEDMSIGFVLTYSDGRKSVAGISTLDLKQLDEILERHNIGFPIPSARP